MDFCTLLCALSYFPCVRATWAAHDSEIWTPQLLRPTTEPMKSSKYESEHGEFILLLLYVAYNFIRIQTVQCTLEWIRCCCCCCCLWWMTWWLVITDYVFGWYSFILVASIRPQLFTFARFTISRCRLCSFVVLKSNSRLSLSLFLSISVSSSVLCGLCGLCGLCMPATRLLIKCFKNQQWSDWFDDNLCLIYL